MTFGYPPGSDAALIKREPSTGLEGKFSMEYTAAAAIVDGDIGFDTFTDAMVARPEVRSLMRKISRYQLAPQSYDPARLFVDVSITTRQGRHAVRVHHAPGSRGNRMDASQHEAKFIDCARRGLDEQAARQLLAQLQQLDRATDVGQIVRAATPA